MFDRSTTGAGTAAAALALAVALMATTGGGARAADDTKYPNWKGQWGQILTPGVGGQNVRFDPTKAFGPAQQAPLTTYQGYSIGRWIDENGDGSYSVLEVETRGPLKGPRAYDATGLPLAFDRRSPNPRPIWRETSCTEGNNQMVIGKENYFLSGDGLLMPAKKDQPPPDLKYFKQTRAPN
jgi:hypothetical protein